MERNCENCRYFIKYYAKTTGGRLQHPCGFGQCTRDEIQKRTSKKKTFNIENCEFWEHEIMQITERRLSVYREITRIKDRLDEIALILKSDKQ